MNDFSKDKRLHNNRNTHPLVGLYVDDERKKDRQTKKKVSCGVTNLSFKINKHGRPTTSENLRLWTLYNFLITSTYCVLF